MKPNAFLPVQFAAVQVIEKLLQLAGRVHVLEVIKQVHVPERIDGDKGQVRLCLAQVV